MEATKVCISQLEFEHVSVHQSAWTNQVEKLAVALVRNRVAVVSLRHWTNRDLLEPLGDALDELPMNDLAPLDADRPVKDTAGCRAQEFRAGQKGNGTLEDAYTGLEAVARLVLRCLCRSSHLRLRGDAFSELLDDLPLASGVLGASLLTISQSVRNFSKPGLPVLSQDPQEEASDSGLVSVFAVREAQDDLGGQLSVLQVKGSNGSWQDITLEEDEVAVVLGHTMCHATAGLCTPATYRVAGDPWGGTCGLPRAAAHFELRARPAATLERLQEQLEQAGHMVAPKYTDQVSVRSMLEQFVALMSPPKVDTPALLQSAAMHAAFKSTGKRTKRRGSSVHAAEEGDTTRQTRSGGRRGSDGQDGKENGRGGASALESEAAQLATSGSSGGLSMGGGSSSTRRSFMEPGSCALYNLRGRTCLVLDGCLEDSPEDCLTLCVRSFTGIERWFYLSKSIPLGRVFELYCSRMGISLGAVQFQRMGTRVFGADTPLALSLADGEELTAVPECSNKQLQARELGPLFAAVFGGTPTSDTPLAELL